MHDLKTALQKAFDEVEKLKAEIEKLKRELLDKVEESSKLKADAKTAETKFKADMKASSSLAPLLTVVTVLTLPSWAVFLLVQWSVSVYSLYSLSSLLT